MNPKRAQLLSDGYVILRQVVPPGQLDRLRSDIETVVARQRAGDPEWDRTPQPRASIVDQVDAATIGAFEFLLHENTHGVSAEVLDSPVEAVASNQALVICNPEFRPEDPPRPGQHWGTDPRNWHRDVRPDRDGPLSAHIEDQLANGPGYVQWNIALYEDHILYVVPGSHRRLSTEIESSHLQGERGTTSPVPESRPVELGPGDGVVYNNLMLHWGSKYGPEAKRRTVHLGYRSFGRTFPRQQCNLPMGFWNRFAAGTTQRRVAEHWFGLFQTEFATIEETFRAALSGNEEGFRAGLRRLHPPENGRRTCLILLAKLALAVHQQRSSPGGDGAGRSVYEWQLQELASRFSDPELARLWQRFEPIDEALRSGASRHVSGFLGPTTDYEFEKVPAGMTAEGMCAEILGQPQRFVHSRPAAAFRLKPVPIEDRNQPEGGCPMTSRRTFLKQLGAVSAVSPLMARAVPARPSPREEDAMARALEEFEPRGWKRHMLVQGDGKGGWVVRMAEIQFHHYTPPGRRPHPVQGQGIWAFGVVEMDNGEWVLLASWDTDKNQSHGTDPTCEDFKGPVACEKLMIAFSRDRGQTWTNFRRIEGGEGRPVQLTYLGKGNLMFQTDRVIPILQYFSSDYGRTWESSRLSLSSEGKLFSPCDSNILVDRDADGVATRLGEIGYQWPAEPSIGMVRWSEDGGRTWGKEVAPPQWQWPVEYRGRTYTVATNEGSLVRAANGWVVAALRTDLHPRVRTLNNGGLAGTVVSISKDDGLTWSPIKVLFEAGRHHPHLLRLPNGDIVMTVILRQDVENGKLVSYRRGCEAVISRDNGQSWDVAHRYILDDFEYSNGLPLSTATGHLYSTLLDDGHILTCYGHYPSKGACLIRWKPTAA